jgi:hypothetical protein
MSEELPQANSSSSSTVPFMGGYLTMASVRSPTVSSLFDEAVAALKRGTTTVATTTAATVATAATAVTAVPTKSFPVRQGANPLDKALLYFKETPLYMERNGKRLDGISITGDMPKEFNADFCLRMGWPLTIWPEFVIASENASLARKGIQSHHHLDNYFNKYVLGSRPTEIDPILKCLFVAEGRYKGHSLHSILHGSFHNDYWHKLDKVHSCTVASHAYSLAMYYPTFDEIEAIRVEDLKRESESDK